MSFAIEYIGPTDQPELALGRIEIGEHSEHFQIDITFWDRVAYETQWKTGVLRLVEGASSSCLLQSMPNPETANFIFWWKLFRLEDGRVALQNAIVFTEELGETFDADEPYRYVGPRETHNEDGERISEWYVTLDELAQFERALTPGADPRPAR